jgi:hypothetical protein
MLATVENKKSRNHCQAIIDGFVRLCDKISRSPLIELLGPER